VTGKIKSLQAQKGYGFIDVPGTKDEYFFHRDDFNGHWQDLVTDYTLGDRPPVEFEGKSTPKGKRASNVKRIDWPNLAS
jgi:cold shock CspA family protein